METWNERLKQALTENQITASNLAHITGLSPAAIKKWIDGLTAEPKYTDVVKTCDALGISPAWLMEGKVTALANPLSPHAIALEKIDIKASCGVGTMNFEDFPEISKVFVNDLWFNKNFSFYKPDQIKIITAQGDSMSPDIEDGDAVFVDVRDNINIRDGIYAFCVEDEFYIKRAQRLPGIIRFLSTNDKYHHFDVPLKGGKEARFLGRVIKALVLKDL